ncbi:Myosin tail region-interacting protein MTI1 [Candida tropicalis]
MEVPFQVKSLFPYESTYEDDLTFGSGVVITVTSIENDEWYSGEYNGKSGMFPKNFVEIIQTPIVPTSNRPTKHQPKEEVKQEPIVEKESEPQPPAPAPAPTPQVETPAIAKPVSVEPSHSIPKPANQGSIPMPKGFGASKPVDPYSIKKQFVAASTSSYVPKVKPRDDSNLVAHPVHETKHADVRSSFEEPEREHKDDIEEAQPKMTLKERIAMIQKQQQEEAEREAAALKKKEERKKRQAAEREKLQQLKHTQAQSPQMGVSTQGTGASIENETPVSPIEGHHHHHHHHHEHGAGAEGDDDLDAGEQAEVEDEQDEEQDQDRYNEEKGRDKEEDSEEPQAKDIKSEEEPVVQEPIRLEKRIVTDVETTGYDADLSEASKAEERKEEEDDEQDLEHQQDPHPYRHATHAPPPPPPTTREADEVEEEEEAAHEPESPVRHNIHRDKEAPPPPPPVTERPPPPPPPVDDHPPAPSGPPPIPEANPVFAPESTPPIPGSAPPLPGSFTVPSIPSTLPPSIPSASAPPPPIPGTVPPPFQSRHVEEDDEEEDDNDDADFEFVDKAPPVPTSLPRAQTLGAFTGEELNDDEHAPSLPKRSATILSHHSSRSPRTSIDSGHKRKSLDLSISRSRSLKDNASIKSHGEITSEIERIVPDLIYKLENQKISNKGNKKVQVVLELDYQNGTLVNHDVRVKSHH